MCAAIKEYVHAPLLIPHHQDGLTNQRISHIVPWSGNLAFVTNKDPGLGKNGPHFSLIYLWIRVDPSMNPIGFHQLCRA
jgi:hypothetical protein